MPGLLKISPSVSSEELNALFALAWADHPPIDFRPLLERALFHVCAYENEQLIGFAKVIGDGGQHGFLLDPSVAPEYQCHGIGRQLVQACAEQAKLRGIEWLHVDYEPHLCDFYRVCGFTRSEAGLLNLRSAL